MNVVIKSANQMAHDHGVKVLTYGRSGMGKTVLAATAPYPIVLSAEAGVLSLQQHNLEKLFGVNTPGITYNVPVIEIRTIQELIDIEQWCRLSAEARQFQTICPDSITEIAEVVLSNAKGQVKDPRQAYGELLEKMTTTIKAFRDLPGKNVYMSAKEGFVKDEVSGGLLAGPAMPGSKLGPALPYYFDEVFNIGMAKDPGSGSSYRYIRTAPDFMYDAKDRSGMLNEIEVPHLGYLFDKIQGRVQ